MFDCLHACVQERVQQQEQAAAHEQLLELQTSMATKQATLQSLQIAHMHAQVCCTPSPWYPSLQRCIQEWALSHLGALPFLKKLSSAGRLNGALFSAAQCTQHG